jgi:hypothetical protein
MARWAPFLMISLCAPNERRGNAGKRFSCQSRVLSIVAQHFASVHARGLVRHDVSGGRPPRSHDRALLSRSSRARSAQPRRRAARHRVRLVCLSHRRTISRAASTPLLRDDPPRYLCLQRGNARRHDTRLSLPRRGHVRGHLDHRATIRKRFFEVERTNIRISGELELHPKCGYLGDNDPSDANNQSKAGSHHSGNSAWIMRGGQRYCRVSLTDCWMRASSQTE